MKKPWEYKKTHKETLSGNEKTPLDPEVGTEDIEETLREPEIGTMGTEKTMSDPEVISILLY